MNRGGFALLLGLTASVLARLWSEDVIYLALTDRFAEGDASNNVPPGSDPALYDASHQDISRYHGGDFRGLENAIASDYFNDLGVSAIWITPPVKNVWRSRFDLGGPKTGYHGYWTLDFLDIGTHLTSAKTLDLSGASRKSESFTSLSRLTKLRSTIPVLRTGATVPLWGGSPDSSEDDGVFAFARVGRQAANPPPQSDRRMPHRSPRHSAALLVFPPRSSASWPRAW